MDMVNHPPHYQGVTRAGRRIEVIDVIEGYGLGYHLGNAVKYICRAGKKSLDARRDLEKAIWYVRRAAARGGILAAPGERRADAPAPAEVAEAHGLCLHRAMALGAILTAYPHRTDMDNAAAHLAFALEQMEEATGSDTGVQRAPSAAAWNAAARLRAALVWADLREPTVDRPVAPRDVIDIVPLCSEPRYGEVAP